MSDTNRAALRAEAEQILARRPDITADVHTGITAHNVTDIVVMPSGDELVAFFGHPGRVARPTTLRLDLDTADALLMSLGVAVAELRAAQPGRVA